jgi:YD repeat-containing protein
MKPIIRKLFNAAIVSGLSLVSIASPAGTQYGIDYRDYDASATTGVDVDAIKKAGKQFVGEYIGTVDGVGHLRPADVTALQGLQIVSLFERNPTDPSYFTLAQAESDADDAIAAAIKAGQPSGTAIYFTVDPLTPAEAAAFSTPTALSAIDSYFIRIRAYFDKYFSTHPGIAYDIGVYAPGFVLQTVMNDTSVGASYSWVGHFGSPYSQANIAQIRDSTKDNPILIGGIPVDLDEAYTANFGQWGSSPAHPYVRVMPDGVYTPTKYTAYTWAGNSLDVWGNVTWIGPTSGNYVWDFGDGTPAAANAVGDPRNIVERHTYGAAGTYYATLTVTDTSGASGSAQVRIDVRPSAETQAQINLAIERGLKNLYLSQSSSGAWYNEPAPTAVSVLAFENRAHLPISPTTDIYQDTVVRGLNYVFTTLIYRTASSYSYPGTPYNYNPDVNGDGAILGQYDPSGGDESFYPHGMIMMALAAAGPYDKNYSKTDALHNAALNLTVPAGVANIGGWTYYKVLDDMMEFAAWAQCDPYYSSRGGWRYTPNSSDADNSVGQWPVIGLEAAEQWGIVAPTWVKSELKNYWLVYSYSSSYKNWGYDAARYYTMAHYGAGLSMMAYVGIPQTDPWYVQAMSGLLAHWADDSNYTFDGLYWTPFTYYISTTVDRDNYYALYGIAKAFRIARDASGSVSAINQIGTHDWYSEYSAHILAKQQSDGSWPSSGGGTWFSAINTPFALLILEPTVSSLRPQAAISASPNPVHPGTTVNFDIRGSSHQDPSKFLVSWKLIFDTSSGATWSSPDVQGTFPPPASIPKAGGYPETGNNYDVTAMVQVTDDVGETAVASVVVHITSAWVAPIANPGGPYFGRVNFPVTLDGSQSYSPNPGGTITKYEWDLDGNGTYETDAGASPTLSHTWTTPYSGYVGLRVTDNLGKTATASVYTTVVVSDLKPVAYSLISSRRISQFVWEYVYKQTLKNQGTGDASNVSAQLQNWPSQVTVVQGTIHFGTIAAGTQVTSSDTFTIRIDRRTPVQNVDLTWKVTYTDVAGTTWQLVNFPLF